MDDDNQEGPFAVWHMFNAPTIVLFSNLENAVDGLDRLLTSILKLTGDFSEVLVPRPGLSKYPDSYYKAFNTWLVGRLFYIWSVKELNRIHVMSKEAQLKILNILCVNNASFYDSLHSEYLQIVKKLCQYYKSKAEDDNLPAITLVNFTSQSSEIPNTELNLEPIHVVVKDMEICMRILRFSLDLLTESVPMGSLQMEDQFCDLFQTVLYMFEYYSMDVKLISLKFFSDLICNYDKMSVTTFSENFPQVFQEFTYCIEAMVTMMPLCFEECEVNQSFIEEFNDVLKGLLHVIDTSDVDNDILKTISCVILNPKHSKMFNKSLVSHCLNWSSKYELPQHILNLNNRNSEEIDMLKEHYTKTMAVHMTTEGDLQSNLCFQQLHQVLESIKNTESLTDNFLMEYHIKRCSSAMNIILNVFVHNKNRQETSHMLINKDIIDSLSQIIAVSRETLLQKNDLLEDISSMILVYAVICRAESLKLMSLICLQSKIHFQQHELNFHDTAKITILKYLLVFHIVLRRKVDDFWMRHILFLLSSVQKNKSTEVLKNLLLICPLLLESGVQNVSKTIGEILVPALLTKEPTIQQTLCKTVPVLACMALGSYNLALTSSTLRNGDKIFTNNALNVSVTCSKCHRDENALDDHVIVLQNKEVDKNTSTVTATGQRTLFAKFLNPKLYRSVSESGFYDLVIRLSNHTIISTEVAKEIYNKDSEIEVLGTMRQLINNVLDDEEIEMQQKDSILNICVNILVEFTRRSLESTEYSQQQTRVLDYIQDFGLSKTEKVLLPCTKLVVYFIMHPQCPLSPKAVVYLRDICEAHDDRTPNQVYHRYKKDYCKLFVDCSLHNGKNFALSLLKVVRAFGFVGYRDFISKDVHHFLPYLIPYSVKIKEVPSIIQEIASLVQCSVSDFLIERFPHVYTHIYLYESEAVSNKCYDLIEKLTKHSTLSLVKRHFRVILTEFLLQFCCNPERVLNACRYLARHDPDVSISSLPSTTMTTSQIADFLQPKFLGVLAYFDHKLVNAKVALSVKRKALQSFPDIMNLMGAKYLTPLRFKVLATLRSALSLAKEFPKILANAWSGFIHNIDSMSLGSLLTNLAVSLLQQYEYAPHDVNKIFQYLVISNENLLSSHISDLFFLEDSKISEKVKIVVRKHVRLTQPESFLDRVKWYINHLDQDIPTIRACAFTHLERLLKSSGGDIHSAIFGGKNIDPVIVELIDCLLSGCKDPDEQVSVSAGSCLGQLGAVEAGRLPRRYVQPSGSPFAFSISDDCFAAAALTELARAFQYEKLTMNMDCYALTIQEILKIYNISPTGEKKDVWNSFPENMHQVLYPLLSSRYTLAYPSQPKKAHPLFGSPYATSFLEWAYNWAGQLIPLIESESIRELLRTVHPSMRRDVRTLFLFLPYVLLHAVMSKNNSQYIKEEILAVIGLENFENVNKTISERSRYKLLRHLRMTPNVSGVQAEEGNQNKCSKMIYNLLDFLNRWLLEWSNTKQNPLQNENYKAISTFLSHFDKLEIAKGNLMCGEFTRALQYLEMYMIEAPESQAQLLPLLAEVYALLDEPDCVAGIQSLLRSEPSLKQLVLSQVVTGRLQDAALCYESLVQSQSPIDRYSLQGMVDCYLGLDQPFTAYRLLSEHQADEGLMELAAEPLWRLGRFEELERLVKKPIPPSRENWGLLMGRILLSYRSQDAVEFQRACDEGTARLLSQMDAEAKGENALNSGYQSVLGLHIIKEAQLVQEMFVNLKSYGNGTRQSVECIKEVVEECSRRRALVHAAYCNAEPLLRTQRVLFLQTQELLAPTHPQTAATLKSYIGDLWLRSAKLARKAGIFQQSYMYLLNAEEYRPDGLFIEKAKMYWARGQRDQAFTTVRRGLDDSYPQIKDLNQTQRKLYAKAKLLLASFSEEAASVDRDVNATYYREAAEAFPQWEKSLVCLGEYYEKLSGESGAFSRRLLALNSYGKSLQYGHKYLYQSMPRMLSIWLDHEVTSTDANSRMFLSQLTEATRAFASRLPQQLYLTAFSQIVSRICHPEPEVYTLLKAIIVKLIIAYPQHTLWMMISVIKSSYPQRKKRCQDVFADPRLKEPKLLKLLRDFTQLAENFIELCNKPIPPKLTTTTVSAIVRTLPRLLESDNFSHIMMPFEEFCKIVLPSKASRGAEGVGGVRAPADPPEPPVYIAGILEHVSILPSLQKPRKVTLKGSDGKSYIIMLKPHDDLRRDFRLMEFNGVVNRFLQDAADTRRRRLYIRTYSVLPLNELCGLIQWLPNLVGLRLILLHIYKQKGMHTSNKELKEMMCSSKDPVEKKRRIFEEQLLPRHPPVFHQWFRRVFSDPYGWYQARSAYIRTTAVMSMVGYILGLGDRHGENISFDSTNGDTVHVDFNCLFNKGEAFEWPERVPFRLTHNMEAAMGPLKHEGMYRKCCEAVMRVMRSQTAALMSVVRPFVYDPLVSWGRQRTDAAERTNEQALQHLHHIQQRLNGMVRTNDKQLSLALSPEGQVEHLIAEATSIHNLCQMYIGWGPFL